MAIEALSLETFKKMDYYAVEKYGLSIELMMENAGLQLARLIALKASKECKITVGVGNGNNGGGGLVAARRLAAWGYDVYLDLAVDITKNYLVSS
ncbi:MAG: NAD(P)H-hydrate epimerase [Maribacter sp.]|jgi:NAD(P)H-hydrate epimerase